MSLFTEAEVRLRAMQELGTTKFSASYSPATASEALRRAKAVQESAPNYNRDIFLSHSFADQILIYGVKLVLEDHGYSVYVDWIDDRELDRSQVTKATANRLRSRMNSCKSLLFATTANSTNSKWMPWELGYFDGKKGRSGIMPLAQASSSGDTYYGQEYLGVYPYLVRTPAYPRERLTMHTSPSKFVLFRSWVDGVNPPE